MQKYPRSRRPWHITFGTYGTRLHGGVRPTVDLQHNQLGTPFVTRDPEREQQEQELMLHSARLFIAEQRLFIEAALPSISERGGWDYRIAAAETDHVHLLCDVEKAIHGRKVRRLVKRWLGQQLSSEWPLPANATWWAEGGSNKAVGEQQYLNNAYKYILRQRITPLATSEPSRP